MVPGLGRLLLPRVHTLALLSVCGAALVALTAAGIDARHYHVVDPIAGLCLAACLIGTMYPLCVNVGRSLLQVRLSGTGVKVCRSGYGEDGVQRRLASPSGGRFKELMFGIILF